MIPSIAVLITCHNRRLKTVECLKYLFLQKGIDSVFSLNVFLVDDGCTDGTAQEVAKNYPMVNIISGNGTLFWNRGMRLAWESAHHEKEFDYYLWVNDDTFLFNNALIQLIEAKKQDAIVCGTTISKFSKKITYGGYKNNKKINPNGRIQECDYFNGNVVLIPKSVFNQIGFNDKRFHHTLGDFDYALRAKSIGLKNYIAAEIIGVCESNNYLPKWRSNNIPLFKRLKYLYLPSVGCNPNEYFIFDKRHYGLIKACFHYITIHMRSILPFLWKNKIN
jgi:GT2 family glycosyltransferase